MTDRLKLSNPTGDTEIDKVAVAAEQEDRIQQLRKNIAALQAKLARQTVSAAPSPASGGTNKVGARKHGSFKAISTAPSINLTPHGPTMVPIPYPVVQDLSSSVNTARTVRFNACPVYLLDASTQPHCTGDEQGTGKGIKSGTVSGEVKPVQGSSTVRVEGKQVVRAGDACTMNGGNCPGIFVLTPPTSGASPKDALATSNPADARFRSGRRVATAARNGDDPLGLFANQTPAERLAAEMTRDALNGNFAANRINNLVRKAVAGQQLVPWYPNDDAARRQARTTNNLNIALLGPFGAPGAAARLAGGSEDRVAGANEIGAAAMGVAWSLTGMPGRQAISVGPRTAPALARSASGDSPQADPPVDRSPVATTKSTPGAGVRIVGRLNFGKVPGSVRTSSGISIQPTSGKTTTILGSYASDMNDIINGQLAYPKTTDFGPKLGAYNVLNVPDEMYKTPDQFWNDVNKPFLDAAIARGDEIPLATTPTVDVLYRDDGSLTGFGREVQYLKENGYHYNSMSGKMVHN